MAAYEGRIVGSRVSLPGCVGNGLEKPTHPENESSTSQARSRAWDASFVDRDAGVGASRKSWIACRKGQDQREGQ